MTGETIRAAAHALAGARQRTTSTASTMAEAQGLSDNLKARVTAVLTKKCIWRGNRAADDRG